MDKLLIESFRDEINKSRYSWETFRDVNGKNQWNCICSAMDWITVAVDGIDFIPNIKINEHGSKKTFDVLTLLMRIAVIKEGIEQLHRVLYCTKEQYRKDDKTVWKGKLFGMTDNEHFETFRACFGVHPVNLKGFSGERSLKRFASWPFLETNGFSVFLYPSDKNDKNIILSICFEQLEEYANLRYIHLMDMTQMIKQGNLQIQNKSV